MSKRPVKVDRLVKHVRAKVRHHQADQERVFARRWTLEPEPGRPFKVELRVARTRHLMRTEVMRIHGARHDVGPRCRGAVFHDTHRIGEEHRIRPGMVVCRMYLNSSDIKDDGANIIAHECAHAGLAYARNRHADLTKMPGEEVAAYAIGFLHRQICGIAHSMGIW